VDGLYSLDFQIRQVTLTPAEQALILAVRNLLKSQAVKPETKIIDMPIQPNPKGVTEGAGSKMVPTTNQSKRIATMFSRRHTTPWSEKEIKAYRAIGTLDPDDLSALERYYATERAKGDEGRHRRDLATFLNNFAAELDRARLFAGRKRRAEPGFRSQPTEYVAPPLTAEEIAENERITANNSGTLKAMMEKLKNHYTHDPAQIAS